MIICSKCASDGKLEAAERYIFDCRRLNAGRVAVPEVYSVDLCSRHAIDFWEQFKDMADRYRIDAPEALDIPIPATESMPRVPGSVQKASTSVKDKKK